MPEAEFHEGLQRAAALCYPSEEAREAVDFVLRVLARRNGAGPPASASHPKEAAASPAPARRRRTAAANGNAPGPDVEGRIREALVSGPLSVSELLRATGAPNRSTLRLALRRMRDVKASGSTRKGAGGRPAALFALAGAPA